MPNSEVNEQLLIELVHNLPVLWDTSLQSYKDKALASQSWLNVCCGLKKDFGKLSETEKSSFKKLVERKWHYIKVLWSRWRQHEKSLKTAGKCRLRKYIFHDKLQFLEQVESSDNEEKEVILLEVEENKTDNVKKPSVPNTAAKDCIAKKRKYSIKEDANIKLKEEKSKPDLMCIRAHLPLSKRRKVAEDRHLMFCKGIIPSVQNFNEEQVIDFQMGILHLIKTISHGFITHCCQYQCCQTHSGESIRPESQDSSTSTNDSTSSADSIIHKQERSRVAINYKIKSKTRCPNPMPSGIPVTKLEPLE